MLFFKRIFCITVSILLLLSTAACGTVDEDYGKAPDNQNKQNTENIVSNRNNADTTIMSLDRVMSNYVDISLFDEENYADVYLGKKFEIDALYLGNKLEVPTKLEDLEENGWILAEGNTYNANSLVFSYESVDITLVNTDGKKLSAQMFNSSRSSKELSKCYVVKYSIENNYYSNPQDYNSFNINGITNSMAITDIIQTLGTPSHFYAVSDKCYYLDYFISKKDRRNGITIFVNPIDDIITKVEFSYYK